MYKYNDLGNGKAVIVWELPGEEKPFLLNKGTVARSVQVSGEFSGGRVDIFGTNEVDQVPTWSILNDPNGNPLVFFAPRIEQILEDCVKITPKFTGPPAKSDRKIKVSILLSTAR